MGKKLPPSWMAVVRTWCVLFVVTYLSCLTWRDVAGSRLWNPPVHSLVWSCHDITSLINRVRTDPGKVWKVLEFNVEILKALKSLENDHRYRKVWKNPRKLLCWPGKCRCLLHCWLPMHLLILLQFITQSIWSSNFKNLSHIQYIE